MEQAARDQTMLPSDFPLLMHRITLPKDSDTQNLFHWHSFFEITYFESGRATYYVNEKILPVEAGDFIIFNNTEPHGWMVEDDIHALVLMFSVDFVAELTHETNHDLLKPFLERGSQFHNLIAKGSPVTEEMQRLLNGIYEEDKQRDTGYRLIIQANVLNLLALLIRHFTDHSKPDSLLAEKKHAMSRLEGALSYMYSHYSEKITLETIAKICYMSPAYFSTYFKKTTGSTFTQYLIGIRVRQAQRLLKTTSLSALEIALECGFYNMSNFYRLYKKHTGSIPVRNASNPE